MGSGGGGKGGASDSSDAMAELAKGFAKESKPARMDYLQMLTDYMKGGTPQAQIPIIQTATEQSKKATSDTLRSIGDSLSSSGLGGTPYGQGVKAQAEISGNQATAAVPSGILSTLLQQIPNFLTGQQSVAMQGLSGSASADASRYGSAKGASSNIAGGAMSMCCFIFMAADAHGELHPVARRFRDEHMTVENRRGYCMLAEWLVPKMQQSSVWKRAVRMCMVAPMISFGKWYYGEGRVGVMWVCLAAGWMWAFDRIGRSVPVFVRSNGEVV